MPAWLSRTLLIGLAAILLVMPVHAFISTWGGTAIGPLWLWKSWKELLLVLLVLPTLGWLALNREALRALIKNPLAILIALYLVLSGVLAALFWQQNGSSAGLAGLAMNLRYLGVAALAYLLFLYGGLSGVWLKRAMWFVVSAGVFVAIIGILQVLILPGDLLSRFGYDKATTIAPMVLIDDNPGLLRAFATLRGPNDFGAFLILPILILITQLRRLPLWVSITTLGFMGCALLLSSSRSAGLGMLVALAVYSLYVVGKNVSKLKVIGVAAATVLIGASLLYVAPSVPLIRQNVFHSSPGDSSLTEGSTDKHFAATIGGVGRVIMNPLGCGPGCAGPASYYSDQPRISENYFVQIAEETGILGLILFCLILGYSLFLLHRATKQTSFAHTLVAAAAGYVLIGTLLHVWSDDPLSITWWMLAGAVIGYNESNTWKKSKGSSRSKT